MRKTARNWQDGLWRLAMKAIRYLRVALESITAHKLRAILTMLGIIIGVAAVLTTMGIGRGAAANITERIESQDTSLHPALALVAPEYSANARLVHGDTNTQNAVVGATADYAEVRNQEVAS